MIELNVITLSSLSSGMYESTWGRISVLVGAPSGQPPGTVMTWEEPRTVDSPDGSDHLARGVRRIVVSTV